MGVTCFVRTFDDIEIRDISLEDYIAVKGKYATYLPHTAGRYQKKRFRKATVSMIVMPACPLTVFCFLVDPPCCLFNPLCVLVCGALLCDAEAASQTRVGSAAA